MTYRIERCVTGRGVGVGALFKQRQQVWQVLIRNPEEKSTGLGDGILVGVGVEGPGEDKKEKYKQ
jgi:hypothetical protein